MLRKKKKMNLKTNIMAGASKPLHDYCLVLTRASEEPRKHNQQNEVKCMKWFHIIVGHLCLRPRSSQKTGCSVVMEP